MASSSDSQNVAGDHDRRRQLRQDYRSLIAETQRNRQELICPESDGLQSTLDRADTLFEQVVESKCPREAALDSHLMVLVSSLGNERAQKLHTDFHTFEPSEFADKLISFMSDRRIRNEASERRSAPFPKEGWTKLGRVANSFFRRAPAFHFMLGSFERGEAPAKTRKQSASRQKEKDSGPAVVPKQIEATGKSDQEVTTEEVERMLGILHQVTNFDQEDQSVEPVSLFEFVVNPHSFSQTVENIFHLSFLVKDGHVLVELDEDRLPIITPTTPYIEGQTSEPVDRKQVMMSLNMVQWEEIVRVFEIKEPLIPTRAGPSRDVLNGMGRAIQDMDISNGEPQCKKKAHGSSRPAKPSQR